MIKPISFEEVSACADIVDKSFAPIIEKFNIIAEECPGHVGAKVESLLAEKFREGYFPFGYFHEGKQVGFVSITNKGGGIFELNLISVLPEFRHFGFGKKMLDFCKNKVLELCGNKIEIEVLDVNELVKNWYLENSFVHTNKEKIKFLSFEMCCMEWVKT